MSLLFLSRTIWIFEILEKNKNRRFISALLCSLRLKWKTYWEIRLFIELSLRWNLLFKSCVLRKAKKCLYKFENKPLLTLLSYVITKIGIIIKIILNFYNLFFPDLHNSMHKHNELHCHKSCWGFCWVNFYLHVAFMYRACSESNAGYSYDSRGWTFLF